MVSEMYFFSNLKLLLTSGAKYDTMVKDFEKKNTSRTRYSISMYIIHYYMYICISICIMVL